MTGAADTKPVCFGLEAVAEYEEAGAWYHREAGAAILERFEVAVEHALGRIAAQPRVFQRIVVGARLPTEIRRSLIVGFPYALVFIVLPAELRILSVSHVRRRPLHWIDRVPAI